MNDVIERSVFINAGIDRVWSLVSRTGFWVGDELVFNHAAGEGETIVVETEQHGNFPVRVERLDAPSYAAYRWASGYPNVELTEDNTTLVEFRLEEQNGGVLLSVRESGFAALAGDADFRATNYRDNEQGWPEQLALLVSAAEGVLAQ